MKHFHPEGIVNDLFRVSGLDFDKHYSRFFHEATKVMNEWIKEEARRTLSEFEGELDNGFWMHEMYMERIPRDTSLAMSFTGRKDYCAGYNDCIKEHDRITGIAKEIILCALEKMFNHK